MKNFTFKTILTYSLSSALLFSCSTDENDLEKSNDFTSSSSSSALTISNGDIIALKSTGGYLSADDTYLKCKGSSVSDDGEKYQVINHGNDVISLISLKTDKYVSSEFNYASDGMTANRTAANAWEKFDVHYLEDDLIALSNTYNGATKFMCSEGGNANAAFSRDAIGGAWEKFTVEKLSGVVNSGTSSGVFELSEFGIETTKSCSSSTSTSTISDTELNDGEKYTKNGLDYYERNGNSYILTSCDQKGRRTEWKQSSSFSLNNSRKMSYTAKFEDYPPSQTGGVTIAQIHNRGGAGRPLLRVEIIDNKIEFIIVDTYVKSSGSSYAVHGPDYVEGSYLNLSLETGNDQIIAKVTTTSGSKTVTYTKNNSNDDYNIDNKWFTTSVSNNGITIKDGFYFKAGVYNDSGNDSDMPVATFTNFEYEN